jgi:hypothetical protein
VGTCMDDWEHASGEDSDLPFWGCDFHLHRRGALRRALNLFQSNPSTLSLYRARTLSFQGGEHGDEH